MYVTVYTDKINAKREAEKQSGERKAKKYNKRKENNRVEKFFALHSVVRSTLACLEWP